MKFFDQKRLIQKLKDDVKFLNKRIEDIEKEHQDELPTEGEIKKEFVNEFGDAPTKWNKFRLQGAKWAINLLKEKK
jgi:hypothetical protein